MGKKMLEVKNLKTKYVTRFHEDVYAGGTPPGPARNGWSRARRSVQ